MRKALGIIDAFERACQDNKPCVLASVVRVQGSTYRRPGARALFLPEGEIIGLIGGGCLENDLLLEARKTLQTGQPKLLCYDNTSDDEIVWGLGLGCNGKVEILLEPVCAERPGPLAFIAQCLQDRRPGVMATVIRCHSPARLANRRFWDGDDTPVGASRWLEAFDLSTCVTEVRTNNKPTLVTTGDMDLLFENIDLPIRLLIVGAGPDAVPLAAIADQLGWCVEVFDHRESFAVAERFPQAGRVVVAPVKAISSLARTDHRTAVVLMTHHFLNDSELLRGFLESDAGYLGVLGPRTRLERLLDTLRQRGDQPPLARQRGLKGPVGLDIGAETPEEIALSIVAEVQAFFTGHDGVPLSQKRGPIHD